MADVQPITEADVLPDTLGEIVEEQVQPTSEIQVHVPIDCGLVPTRDEGIAIEEDDNPMTPELIDTVEKTMMIASRKV